MAKKLDKKQLWNALKDPLVKRSCSNCKYRKTWFADCSHEKMKPPACFCGQYKQYWEYKNE